MEKTLSVIVPVYNINEFEFKRCIDSILAQSLESMEIIVVDDGSDEKYGHFYKEYARRDGCIRLICKKNEGVSSARNLGIMHAVGRFIGFVDADDFIELDFYKPMLDRIEEKQSDMVVSGFVRDFDGRLKRMFTPSQSLSMGTEKALIELLAQKRYMWSVCDRIFRSATLKDIMLFETDITMGEDLLFIWNITNKCSRIEYIPLYKYHYCYRENSATTVCNPEKKITGIKTFEKLIGINKYDTLKKRLNDLYIKELASCLIDYIRFGKENREIRIEELSAKLKKNDKLAWLGDGFSLRVRAGIILCHLPLKMLKKM